MQIRSSQYLISSPTLENCPKADRPEYAFIGRSNVGKSSVINMITGNAKLAKTSASPGKTQMINHFNIKSCPDSAGEKDYKDVKEWYLVDLPGYGYAKVSQQQRARWKKMIADYLQKRENLVTIFVLVDSRHDPQPNDLEFLDQLGQWQVPFNIIFTKADKSTQRETAAHVRAFINKMREDWEFIPRTFVTSAVKGQGRRDLLGFIEEMNDHFWNADPEEQA